MRRIITIASAVAIAMAISTPAIAKDKGDRGGGKPAKHESRGGDRRFEQARKQAEKRDDDRGKRVERERKHAEKRHVEQRRWTDDRSERRAERREDERELLRLRDDVRYRDRDDRYRDRRPARYGYNCPPGLARKNNGCLPPGQAKKILGRRRAFTSGQVLPVAWFGDYNVPYEYQSWYRDTPDYYYRYDDGGYIYRVDRGSNLIEGLIPLLGGDFGIGQMLPAGYDTYNLPMAYRDDFVDSGDAYYRYGDDAIYEVDPQTGMIESIVALLAGDLNVGGLLPGGYDTYNLPLDYRDQYVDSDEAMYRYADGNIYEVDP